MLKRIWRTTGQIAFNLITLLCFVLGFVILLFLIGGFYLFWTGQLILSENTPTIAVALLATLFAALSSFASMQSVNESRKQRESLDRPYVNAYIASSSHGMMYFRVQNSGNAPALNVELSINPSPVDYSGRMITEKSLFHNPIAFLPVGSTTHVSINASHSFFSEDQPLRFAISAKYKSLDGRTFNDSTVHDLNYMKETRLPEKTSVDFLKTLSQDIHELVKAFRGLQTIDRTILVESLTEFMERQRRESDRIDAMVEANTSLEDGSQTL